jgi:hypothetical protein
MDQRDEAIEPAPRKLFEAVADHCLNWPSRRASPRSRLFRAVDSLTTAACQSSWLRTLGSPGGQKYRPPATSMSLRCIENMGKSLAQPTRRVGLEKECGSIYKRCPHFVGQHFTGGVNHAKVRSEPGGFSCEL